MDTVVVTENTAVPKIAQVFAKTPLETLKAWEAFHVVDQAAPYLSKRFVDSALRVLRTGAVWNSHARARAGSAASSLVDGSDRRGGRQGLRRHVLPAGARRRRWTSWSRTCDRHGGPHREARLDEPGDQGPGAGEAVAAST